MARERCPERDQAYELWIKSKGKLTVRQIAERLGVSESSVKNWRWRDNWSEKKRKRGGAPKGNKNAKGHGAPAGNTNAETHGAYSRPRMETFTPEQIQQIENLTTEFEQNALRQYQSLYAKKYDLERRIASMNTDDEEKLYRDRQMIMQMPDGGTMVYDNFSTAFERRMKLEAELNKTDGRIQKVMDSFKTREEFQIRMDFERERLEFHKAKAMGEFSVPDDERSDSQADGIFEVEE